MKQEKRKTAHIYIRDLLAGILFVLLSLFFLFTKKGKSIFIPLENSPQFLHFYYYLISYALIAAGLFFILRGLKVITVD